MYLPDVHYPIHIYISIRQPQGIPPPPRRNPGGTEEGSGGSCATVQTCPTCPTRPDMPDKPARHASPTCQPDQASQTRSVVEKDFLLLLFLETRQDKTRQDPCSMDGSLVFVATAYLLPPRREGCGRLGGRRGRVCACWVGG